MVDENITIHSSKLPNYKNPPVNEVVCGLQFQASDNLRVPHIGLLWNKFRSEYPIIQHAPPLMSAMGDIKVDSITGIPLPRIWFINKSDDQLVQFQIDRIYFNWRRRKREYPHYNHIINNFDKILDISRNIFNEFNLGEFKPIELELSYINHIPRGQGWETIDDLQKLFSDFNWNKSNTRFLKNLDKIAWTTEFILPEQKGRLNINLKHAIRTEDKMPLLVFEFITKGNAQSDRIEDIHKWFNLAHEWIVQGFTDLTTPEIQKIWGRE